MHLVLVKRNLIISNEIIIPKINIINSKDELTKF